MFWKGRMQRLKVVLAVRVLVITLIAIAASLPGGLFAFTKAGTVLRDNSRRHAVATTRWLARAAESSVRRQDPEGLELLADHLASDPNTLYVAILNEKGEAIAAAGAKTEQQCWPYLSDVPLGTSSCEILPGNVLSLLEPIRADGQDELLGGVRLVLDTSATATELAGIRRRLVIIVVGAALCLIPLGAVLVWRLRTRPLQCLVATMRRLAKGDFSARAGLSRNDEIGELASALDSMAEKVASRQGRLANANVLLEKKIAERTAELEMANRRLQDEIAEKEDFLRAVSHDLNAPLRNISGMAASILTKWRNELAHDAISRLERIRANVESGSALIGELLELLHMRTRPQRRAWVDTGRLLKELSESFEFELESRHIELHLQEPMPLLYIDGTLFKRVFQNLIDNAIKYMDKSEGGWIRIGYRQAGPYHEFSVADNGPGIEPSDQKKVFHVFRRGERATASEVQGKGVGLAMVKAVALSYGGNAWVESVPGHGATFYVSLSVEGTAGPAEDGSQQASGSEARAGKVGEESPVGHSVD